MRYPILKKFLEDPSCVDNGNYGMDWKTKKRYKDRWEYINDMFPDLKVLYFKESDYSYYVYITVPSELRGNTYDVVIHFFTEFDNIASQPNLYNYNIRFFSNNPVFGFHFAHANFIKGMIIDFLADKIPRQMLETRAEKNNPKDAVGFDHSFYHAGMYLLSKSRFLNKTYIENKLLAFDRNTIYALCRPMDQTMEEYKSLRNRQALKDEYKKGIKSNTLDDNFAEIKSKYQNARHKVSGTIDKISDTISSGAHRIQKITARKSNSSKSGVRHIKPRKGK